MRSWIAPAVEANMQLQDGVWRLRLQIRRVAYTSSK